MNRLLRTLVLAALSFALWLLLVEKFTAAELVVGVAVALVTALATRPALGENLNSIAATPRLVAQIWRLPWICVVGTIEIFKVLALHLFTRRKAGSHLLTVPFDAGAEDDPDAAARRALAITYTTMTPNFIVIGIDVGKRCMLYHQLQPGEVPVMTLGEEFILFASVMGVVLLLRKSDEEPACADARDQDDRRRAPATSEAVRALGLALVGFTVTFGLYIVTHGQLTPGGGFQGGVVLASAWVLIYLAGTAETYQRLTPKPLVEALEAVGAAAYALLGAAALLAGGAYFANVLPLGPIATIRSGGTIALASLATGLEVMAGFILLVTTFVEEALAERAQS